MPHTSILSLTLFGLSACSSVDRRPTSIEPHVASELARHGIEPTSEAREHTETVPVDLMAGAMWGTRVGPCLSGGYDLSTAAGHEVRMLRYEIDDVIRDERLYAWVVLDGDRVACVFRSVREDSEMAPGVFPASGD
jgi:hypothetical protein